MMGRTDIAKKDISKSNLLAHNLKKHHFSTETTYNHENLCGKKKIDLSTALFSGLKKLTNIFLCIIFRTFANNLN